MIKNFDRYRKALPVHIISRFVEEFKSADWSCWDFNAAQKMDELISLSYVEKD
jgi:hypothetical protein